MTAEVEAPQSLLCEEKNLRCQNWPVVPSLYDWTLQSHVCVIPHPDKAHKGGEDAFYISEDGKIIAVADGW
jgi:hypothetical protein